MSDRRTLLRQTADLAADFLEGIGDRPVRASATHDELMAAFGGPLPDRGEASGEVVSELARIADPGLIASAGPRYFGFVIGGGLPAALAADWLTSAWDQNAGLYAIGPAASVAEEVAGRWLIELFGLPAGSSIGYSTGATMASFTGLAAGRHRVLERAGWNVEEDGLVGAPDLAVVVGAEAHVTIHVSLQMLGLGRNRVYRVDADEQGRMRPDALRAVLAGLRDRPVLVSAQSGNVNTGAFDPLPEIVAAVRELPNAWLHVDGAFGLWAAVSPRLRHLTDGLGDADSWTTDAHKWLNVPYDAGIVIVRDVAAHHAAMTLGAAYYVETAGAERDPYNWVAESSRRARGFPIYAALRELGREGLVEMIDRCCALARRMADGLRDAPGVTILNDVVLNQVLVRFAPPTGSGAADAPADAAAIDAFTREVIAEVQRDGTCWLGGTTWHGMAAMRISVSNWSTTEADADLSVAAIRRCAAAVAAGGAAVQSPQADHDRGGDATADRAKNGYRQRQVWVADPDDQTTSRVLTPGVNDEHQEERMAVTIDLAAVKDRQRAAWASGDYAVIGTTLQLVGESLAEAVDLRWGERVIDVAAGNGNATLAAARRGAAVTSTDYVQELLDRGAERARAERLDVSFEVADAEHLPYPDGSFDVALSTFGVMFAPDHTATAGELARVTRSGGRIGLANWTPQGFIGEMFKVLGRHVPPPAGVQPPALWGTEEHLQELFGEAASDIAITPRVFTFRYASAAHFVDVFRRWYGPVHKAFGSLPEDQAAALEADLIALVDRFNRSGSALMVVPSDYLEVVVTRR